ncbi:uncharacterized protein LOC121059203 isoform X2 [Cygnus olor]|uniref:uncharacterized protein LOC121059203 isoform X2 n=1 Tax=Cygnus olor TaxID=8869 RepID=UPI001ADDEB73|nr:uncharacterized protein LOC121059203 isoform X2 [Cygnus olor]
MTTLQRLLLSCVVRAFYSLPSPRGLACRRGFGGGVNSRPAFQSSELCHCVVRQVGSGDAVIIAGHAGRLFKAPGGQVRAAFQTLPRQLKGVKDESRREASVWGLNVIILALGSCLPCSRRVSVLAAGQLPCDSLPCTAASLTGGRGRLPIGRGRALGPKAPRHWRRRRWQVKSPRGLAEGWVSNLNVGCARRERCCRPSAAVTNNEDGQLCLEVLRTQPALSLVLLAEEVTRLCSGVVQWRWRICSFNLQPCTRSVFLWKLVSHGGLDFPTLYLAPFEISVLGARITAWEETKQLLTSLTAYTP